MAVTGALDPTLLDMQEKMREHAMYPKCFDVKTAQLMLFGMLLMDLSDAAQLHGIAARRAGASFEELQAVVSLCSCSAACRGQSRRRNFSQPGQARIGRWKSLAGALAATHNSGESDKRAGGGFHTPWLANPPQCANAGPARSGQRLMLASRM